MHAEIAALENSKANLRGRRGYTYIKAITEFRSRNSEQTNRASRVSENTQGMFRGTQTHRVSALWMQRSGPPP